MANKNEMTPFTVDGKRAIVTGAGSGINLSFAKLLLSKGCSVVFADLLLRPEARSVVDEYSGGGEGKPRAVFVETDVTDWSQLSKMFDTANKEFGGVDIVCPGAGIFEPHWTNFWHPPGSESSKDSTEGGRYALIDINITHPIRTSQLAITQFLSPVDGEKVSLTNPKRIIHISSIAGQRASPVTPLYAASKHAINGFVRSLAFLEGSLGIRVNGVAPGLILTPLWTDHPEKQMMFDVEKDVWATPEEVAEAMLSCLEDEDLPGGTILEVGHKSTRKVQELNDPGPQGEGHTVSGYMKAVTEVFTRLGKAPWSKAAPS